jgi:hypothetical protein
VERCDDVDDDCDPATYGSGVVWTSAAGVDTDVSATFAAGTPATAVTWTSTASGTLSFCDGTWFTRLILNHDVDVIGWGPVTLDAAEDGPVVVVTGAGVDVRLTDLTLLRGQARSRAAGASGTVGAACAVTTRAASRSTA